MPKEKHIKVEIELPAWLVRSIAQRGCHAKTVLEDEVGREVVARAIREAKK